MATTILVVEDDDDFRSLVSETLREDGYEVATARGGNEALEWLRTKTAPSLILLDFHLPEMTGAQFLEIRRNEPALAEVPVVLMTGDVRTLDDPACHGADALIKKPMSREVLVATLRALVPMQ